MCLIVISGIITCNTYTIQIAGEIISKCLPYDELGKFTDSLVIKWWIVWDCRKDTQNNKNMIFGAVTN